VKSINTEVFCLKSDISDPIALEREILFIKPDLVLHLAGISYVASKDHEAFYRVHVLGTTNLLNTLTKLEIAPKKIVLASSATVYGNCTTVPTPETQPISPVDHYAMSKAAMEELAKRFMDRLPIIIARPFNYTGPGQHGNFLIPKLIRHFVEKQSAIELGNLNVEREFNDVSTICNAYLGLLDAGIPGETYNICTGNLRSLGSIIDTLIKITNHSIQININPEFVRPNEVYQMCGNPDKLMTLLAQHKIELYIPTIEETIKNMLKNQPHSHNETY